jgi:hypothetical protein
MHNTKPASLRTRNNGSRGPHRSRMINSKSQTGAMNSNACSDQRTTSHKVDTDSWITWQEATGNAHHGKLQSTKTATADQAYHR